MNTKLAMVGVFLLFIGHGLQAKRSELVWGCWVSMIKKDERKCPAKIPGGSEIAKFRKCCWILLAHILWKALFHYMTGYFL